MAYVCVRTDQQKADRYLLYLSPRDRQPDSCYDYPYTAQVFSSCYNNNSCSAHAPETHGS